MKPVLLHRVLVPCDGVELGRSGQLTMHGARAKSSKDLTKTYGNSQGSQQKSGIAPFTESSHVPAKYTLPEKVDAAVVNELLATIRSDLAAKGITVGDGDSRLTMR